jgi:hypothetical protein
LSALIPLGKRPGEEHPMSEWNEPEAEATRRAFRRAAAQLLDNVERPTCPDCGNHIRFYRHVFQRDKLIGTIWVWCGSCHIWIHERLKFAAQFPDPLEHLSLLEFAELESNNWLSTLDKLWTEKKIPLTVAPR